MRRAILLTFAFAPGCVIYAEKHVVDETEWSTSTWDTGTWTEPAAPDPELSINPDQVVAGDIVLASITAAEADFDYTTITDVAFADDAVVVADAEARAGELLVVLDLTGATEGAVDGWVTLTDGDRWFLQAPLQIAAAPTSGTGTGTGGQ